MIFKRRNVPALFSSSLIGNMFFSKRNVLSKMDEILRRVNKN